MSKVVKFKAKINWSTWLILVILWNFGFQMLRHYKNVLVAVFCRFYLQLLISYNQEACKKGAQEVNSETNEGTLIMGIHYDYKSTRGDKAMKKEAKRKARIEQRRAKRSINSSRV